MDISTVFCALSLLGCCISLLNFVRYDELRKKYEVHDHNLSRKRRDIGKDNERSAKGSANRLNESLPFLRGRQNSLFTDINELKGFIKEELQMTIDAAMHPALEKKLNDWLREMKCNCIGSSTGPRGPKGERGERGPRGERGEPGPSLHPPELKNRNLTITANMSDSKTFTCQFLSNPLPIVRWKSSARHQQVREVVDRSNSLVTSELKVGNITWEDRGNVTCYASNLFGKAEGSGALIVHTKPIISLPTEPLIATLGSVADFPKCQVISEPQASVTWSRGFLPFPPARTSKKDGELKINKVQVNDEGHYVCTAKNYLGTSTKYLQLRVKHLQFSKIIPQKIYRSNVAVNLTCAARGSVKRLNGKWIVISENGVGKELNYTSAHAPSEAFFTTEATTNGKYKCLINDGVSTIETLTEVALFKMNSTLIQPAAVHTLGQWLSKDVAAEYKLCWRMSKHGNSTESFYENCGNKTNTITIFKSKEGRIWGGFTDVPWRKCKIDKAHNRRSTSGKVRFPSPLQGIANGVPYIQGHVEIYHNGVWGTVCDDQFDNKDAQVLCRMHGYDRGEYKTSYKQSSARKANKIWLDDLNCTGLESDIGSCRHAGWGKKNCNHNEDVGIRCYSNDAQYKYSYKTYTFSGEKGRMTQMLHKDPNKAVCCGSNYGPCFGEKSILYDQNRYLAVRNESSFLSTIEVKDVEVFYKITV